MQELDQLLANVEGMQAGRVLRSWGTPRDIRRIPGNGGTGCGCAMPAPEMAEVPSWPPSAGLAAGPVAAPVSTSSLRSRVVWRCSQCSGLWKCCAFGHSMAFVTVQLEEL